MAVEVVRRLVWAYLWIYDQALRLGALRGALLLGYGPIALAILAFAVKSATLDPLIGSGGATVVIFALFALCGPLMNAGTKIAAEHWQKSRSGQWPATTLAGFDKAGSLSPTMAGVEKVRHWAA